MSVAGGGHRERDAYSEERPAETERPGGKRCGRFKRNIQLR